MSQESVNTPVHSERRVAANVLRGSIGNLIEWYDWYAYAAFAIYFAHSFFPAGNSTTQLLNTAAVFAVGFLMRPLGGWLLGRLADRYGRRNALVWSVVMMSAGSLLITVTPGHQTIGAAAPILLVLARLFQGLSVGGEYSTSATYLSEVATPGKRGFYSSFQYVTLISGQLIALGVQLALQSFLTRDELMSFGWRIPFAIGAIGALAVMCFRRRMDESDSYQQLTRSEGHAGAVAARGTIRELRRYPKQVAIVFGLTLGGTVAFYTYTTYLQQFMVNTSGIAPGTVTWINFAALLVFVALQPLAGRLSDKIGRRPMLIFFAGGGAVLTVPVLSILAHTTQPLLAFALMMVCLVVVTSYTSINAVVKAELFPTHVRALGVGLPYAITVAVFGGTAETVALWLKSIGHESLYFWYVSALLVVSLAVAISMRDTTCESTFNDQHSVHPHKELAGEATAPSDSYRTRP